MSHQDTYRRNETYAEFLANWDANFYAKYADTLRPGRPGARALDVGCGAGQVVDLLTKAGFEAWGVDVSEPNIARARRFSERCQFYDGRRLPFPDQHFAGVGALNVLEHVQEPEAFITELAPAFRETPPDRQRSGASALRPHDAHRERTVHAGRRRHRRHQRGGDGIFSDAQRVRGGTRRMHRSLRGRARGFPLESWAVALSDAQFICGGAET